MSVGAPGVIDSRSQGALTEAAAVPLGERVVVTRHGQPFVALVLAQRTSGTNFEKAAIVRRELGLDGLNVELPPDFDYPAFSRRVVALPDEVPVRNEN